MPIRRTWPAVLLALLGGLCLMAANLAFWAGDVVYDPQAFRKTTRAALAPETVRREIAGQVVAAMLGPEADLDRAAPEMLVSALTGLLGSQTLTRALDAVLDRAWHILVERMPAAVTLDATGLRDMALRLVSERHPKLAARISATATPYEVELLAADAIPSLAPYRTPLTRWFWAFVVGTFLFGGLSLWLTPDRRSAVGRLGLIIAAFALLLVLLALFAPTLVSGGDAPLLGSAVRALTLRLLWQTIALFVVGAGLYFSTRASAGAGSGKGASGSGLSAPV